MDWVNQYIGLPYEAKGRSKDAVDCWGLVRLVLQEQKGFILPSFTDLYDDPDNHAEVTKALSIGVVDWGEVDDPEPFDVVILRLMGEPWHCSLYLGDGIMLHTMRGHMSAIEKLDSVKWRNRIEGYYRWSK
jgi:cell wall-associated NlpC family hydrolase